MHRHLPLLALLCLALCGSQLQAAASPPNLIVIMADDLGYSDVGFNGCTDIPTPNIDRIAKEGAMFSNAYVSYAVCSPSRAGFLTGRYQGRFGFGRNPQYRPQDPNMGLPPEERTLAAALKTCGYSSGIIGKWHLGAHRETHHPLNRGFDEFFGHLGGGHRYFPHELTIQDSYSFADEDKSYRSWIMRDHEPVKTTKYLTDEFSDEALAFIDRHHEKPFFLFLAYNAPHAPLQATEKYLARFPGIKNTKRKTYAAMVSALDDGVGRLLARLAERGIDEQTMIVFLSDNGGPTKDNASNNKPLRGTKGSPYEGGFRVPFALRWPGHVQAGQNIDALVSSLDIFATIASQAGYQPEPERPLDGLDLMPLLTGDDSAFSERRIFLRLYDRGAFAIRHRQHKLLIGKTGAAASLYRLDTDIGEQHDLASDDPERLATLREQLDAWVGQLQDPRFLGLIHTERWQKKLKNKNEGH